MRLLRKTARIGNGKLVDGHSYDYKKEDDKTGKREDGGEIDSFFFLSFFSTQ